MATKKSATASAKLEPKETKDAIKQLEQVEVLHLTKEETDKLEETLLGLPTEVLNASVELCYRMTLVQIRKGNLQEAYRWYNTLSGLRDSADNRALLENRIFCAGLCLPQGPNTNLLLNFAVLSNEFANAKFPLARLSSTGGFPSVLRGAKDLSALGKHYRASASIVRPLLPAFLEDNGNGVCETAISELLYEQDDLNGASLQVAAAINAKNPETAFAALSILARIGAVDRTAREPAEILAHIGEMLEKKEADWLLDNYKALCARFHILFGEIQKVREWTEGCELNDLDTFIPLDFYMLLTKAKAYIALGEYRNAVTLLESLAIATQNEGRPLDTAECLIHGAVACELLGSGDIALGKLEQALLLTQEYGYVRVFADCGKRLYHLLSRYVKEEDPHEAVSEQYIKKVLEATKAFSLLYPALYDAGNEKQKTEGQCEELTNSELQVLQLLDQGKTNKDIAKELYVEATTVRFHISNILQKLGASNRTEASKIARDKGLIS